MFTAAAEMSAHADFCNVDTSHIYVSESSLMGWSIATELKLFLITAGLMVNQLHSLKKEYLRFFSVGFVHLVIYTEHKHLFVIWLYHRPEVLVLSHFSSPKTADIVQRNNYWMNQQF
jgi:hypothetical protein